MRQSILFILKKNECYGFTSYTRRSSGLWNSTRFIVDSLRNNGISAKIVEVQDNNSIDREVAEFKPDLVVLEALWCVPEKFDVLKKLHPKVQWYCHLHSQIPFLAMEGIATQWIHGYVKRDVAIIANAGELYLALRPIVPPNLLLYLPNVYVPVKVKFDRRQNEALNIGCFGAIRPLKNQLMQALCAIEFARAKKKFLRFHINGTRVETLGDPVLKNLRMLFSEIKDATLVEHPWYEPEAFHQVLADMDIGMQVSLTETFNVVTADYVSVGIPIVVSSAVPWVAHQCWADPASSKDIVRVMERVYSRRCLIKTNLKKLLKNSLEAQDMWAEFFYEETK